MPDKVKITKDKNGMIQSVEIKETLTGREVFECYVKPYLDEQMKKFVEIVGKEIDLVEYGGISNTFVEQGYNLKRKHILKRLKNYEKSRNN